MLEFLINAFEWLICLSEAVVVFLLFKTKLGCEKPKLYFAVAAIPLIATATYVMNILSFPWVVLAFILLLIHFIYALVCFNSSIIMKCILFSVPFAFFCISNYICIFILYVLTDIGSAGLVSGNGARIVLQLLYAAINFGLLFLMMKKLTKDGELPSYISLVITVLSIIGTAVSMYCFSELVMPGADNSTAVGWISCSAVLILSIALILLSSYLSRLYMRLIEIQNELQKTKLEAEHVSQVGAMYNYARELRHDLKGIISTLKGLIDNGEYESVKTHLNELSGEAEKTKLIISTGNPAIDATISAKLMLAEKNDVEVEHCVSIPEKVRIYSMDVCSVIMNLMDNTIEAVSKLAPEKRHIDLNIINKDSSLIIYIKNTCKGSYKFDGGNIVSSKADVSVHGVGLKRVNKIVEKHQGLIHIKPTAQSFEVSILLPLEQSLNENCLI